MIASRLLGPSEQQSYQRALLGRGYMVGDANRPEMGIFEILLFRPTDAAEAEADTRYTPRLHTYFVVEPNSLAELCMLCQPGGTTKPGTRIRNCFSSASAVWPNSRSSASLSSGCATKNASSS